LICTKLKWMCYRVVKKAWQYIQPFWYSTSVWRTDGRASSLYIQYYVLLFISITTSMARNSLLCADVPLRNYSLTTCFSIADARKNHFFHPWFRGVGLRTQTFKNWNFANIIAPKGRVPFMIVTKFTGFMRVPVYISLPNLAVLSR